MISLQTPFLVYTECNLLDLLFFSFLVYAHMLEFPEKRFMADKFVKTTHVWKCLFSSSYFAVWLYSLTNLGKNIFSLRILGMFLRCLQASSVVTGKSEAILTDNPVSPTHHPWCSQTVSQQCALVWILFHLLCWALEGLTPSRVKSFSNAFNKFFLPSVFSI